MDSKEYISSGILESYILGLASPEEAGILECVMKNNAEVRVAFEEIQMTLEELASAQAVVPPDDLKSKIWNKIQLEQLVQDENPVIPTNHIVSNNIAEKKVVESVIQPNTASSLPNYDLKSEKDSSWKTFAIAASLLFLVSLGTALYFMNEKSALEKNMAVLEKNQQSKDLALQNVQQKFDVISNPDLVKVVLKGVEKHPQAKATVLWDTSTKDVYLTANSLPAAPEGMEYQLWALEGGKPINAGMYDQNKDTKIALSTIDKAQAFAITLEKKGGSEVPTMENMYVMGGV